MPQITHTVRFDEPLVVHPGDSRPLRFNFTPALSTATSILSSVVSIVLDPDTSLALGSAGINAEAFNDMPNGQGNTIAVGKAVVATPSGGVAGTDYDVTVTATEEDAEGNTVGDIVGVGTIKCRDGSERDQ